MNRDLGDFQTPDELVEAIRMTLSRVGVEWDLILEPTCGEGSFLLGFGADDRTKELKGIELQPDYVEAARTSLRREALAEKTELIADSLFDVRLDHLEWMTDGRLLVVGNPPWVTNSELGRLSSRNLPKKRNLKVLAGLDAITGAANFDLTEYIWIKVIEELYARGPVVAFICKTHVARNVLSYVRQRRLGVSRGVLWRIDAQAWFGASVDACVLLLDFDRAADSLDGVDVFPTLAATAPEGRLGFLNGELVNDSDQGIEVSRFIGSSSLVWRQGVKHDAARIMELRDHGGQLKNKLGEVVCVEDEYVFPLLKGSDVFHGRVHGEASKYVLIPQRTLGEETADLASRAPSLWAYLQRHADILDGRKSSIYRTQPRFALFGIGPYSFADYKVAVSGLHKEPRFRMVPPHSGRPVMVDDTCYFLPCGTPQLAAVLTAVLESDAASAVLRTLVFTDAKRPLKKQVLKRINLEALVQALDGPVLRERTAEILARAGIQHDGLELPAPLSSLIPQLPLFAAAS